MKNMKEEIKSYGLLFAVLRGIWGILKSLWKVLIYNQKNHMEEIEESKKKKDPKWELFKEWEDAWLSGEEDREKAEDEIFFQLFTYDYKYSYAKEKYNKRKNFRIKLLCMLPFASATVIFLVSIIAYNVSVFIKAGDFVSFVENMDWSFSIYSTAFYGAALIITYLIIKWLDVKKYQETWIRHSKHKYAVEMEMFRYINGMGNYCYENRKKYFVENIMKIWDANRTKFAENMEKESDMKDMLNGIKTVYKKLKDDEESSD